MTTPKQEKRFEYKGFPCVILFMPIGYRCGYLGIPKGTVITTTDSNMIRTNRKRPKYFYGERKDWHMTKESAIQRAEEMRKKKIISIKKQIEKLDKMKFE